jgi:AcrR family transcriptional regulator
VTGAAAVEGRTRTRNPWGQGERLRKEILEAASRMLGALGSEEALSLRAVAREVGIAAPSIYRHFSDKSDLVRAVLAGEYEQLARCMGDADAAVDPPEPVARLRAQLHAYCRYAMDNPGHYRLMFGIRQSPEPAATQARHPVWVVIDSVDAALLRCEEAGHRLRLPRDRSVIVVFVGVHGRVALWHAFGRTNPDPVHIFVDELLALVFEDGKETTGSLYGEKAE